MLRFPGSLDIQHHEHRQIPAESLFATYRTTQRRFDQDDLSRGAVHVWRIDIGALEVPAEITARVLSEDEHDRAARIRQPEARWRFATSRVVLRTLLGGYLGIPAAQLRFDYGAHGKPRLAGSPACSGLVFNASHTAEQLAVALARGGSLGIDIERWRPLNDAPGLAARCLTDAEHAHWSALPEDRRLGALFRYWALKEALCKAIGRGLALDLRHCEFDCTETLARLVRRTPETAPGASPETWSFRELDEPSGFSGAVAINRSARAWRHHTLLHGS
jgi:4'-phosphopantetheinyl transferase